MVFPFIFYYIYILIKCIFVIFLILVLYNYIGDNMKNDQNTIIFNDNILNIINAVSLLFTYLFMGIIICIDKNFFGKVTRAIEIAFVVVGIIGFIFEVRRLNKNFSIKGIDNVLISSLLFPMFLLAKCCVSTDGCNNFIVFIYQILIFVILLLMIFLFCKGIVEVIYSLYLKHKEKSIGFMLSSIIIMFGQVFGLILICVHIFQIAFK